MLKKSSSLSLNLKKSKCLSKSVVFVALLKQADPVPNYQPTTEIHIFHTAIDRAKPSAARLLV